VLTGLASRLCARFGKEVSCTRSGGTLLVSLTGWPETSLGVSVMDPLRPSFAVSYPSVSSGRKGGVARKDVTASGVLESAVVWMTKKAIKFGAVPDEAVDKGW
jgi:hypothetical protein